MKICVLGLDGAAPQVVFRDERLSNLRRLMDAGVYGLLESVVPPSTMPAWACFAASQDPGSLGVYGRRQRSGYSFADAAPPEALTIHDHLAQQGRKTILVGAPSRTARNFVSPVELQDKIGERMRDRFVDTPFPTGDKNRFKEEVFAMSERHWQTAKSLLAEQPWDYFQFTDIGLDRLQHAFWSYFDPKHALFESGNPYENVIPDYYRRLDEHVGDVLDLLDNETVVLVASAYGAQRLDGAFAVNEWLLREGLLALKEYPAAPTAFEELRIDWTRTRAWSDGGYCAQIFFNLQGREPQGVIPAAQAEAFANDLTKLLEALADDNGQSLQAIVSRPKQIYRETRNAAPDLIVELGGMFWRAIGSVGHSRICLGHDAALGGCNHSEFGAFILAAPNCPLQGEYEGARLLDMAPTLLDLAGCEIPAGMQGKSLVSGMEKKTASGGPDDARAQKLIHDRLAGLGYI